MLVRVGRLRLFQDRVLSPGECTGVRDALEAQGAGELEDACVPYSDHVRAQIARGAGELELDHQEPWQAIRTVAAGAARYTMVAPPGRICGALLALEREPSALAFPTAGARAELEAGTLVVWSFADAQGGQRFAETEHLICAPSGFWFLATHVRNEAARPDPGDEITVRRPVVEPAEPGK